jgi:hypothetical protein
MSSRSPIRLRTCAASAWAVAAERQRDIIRELALPMEPDPQFQEILKQLMRATQRTAAEWEKGT